MNNLFGRPRQLGYVVKDIDKAMKRWIADGVGPWFYADKIHFLTYIYQGIPQTVHVSCALAYSGDMQMELIQPRGDAPSSWKAFLDAGHEGLQHFSSVEEDYDGIHRRALEAGYRIEHEGTMSRGRFAYFVNDALPGTVIEVAEATADRLRIFEGIHRASIGWDGKDPIRTVWPT